MARCGTAVRTPLAHRGAVGSAFRRVRPVLGDRRLVGKSPKGSRQLHTGTYWIHGMALWTSAWLVERVGAWPVRADRRPGRPGRRGPDRRERPADAVGAERSAPPRGRCAQEDAARSRIARSTALGSVVSKSISLAHSG